MKEGKGVPKRGESSGIRFSEDARVHWLNGFHAEVSPFSRVTKECEEEQSLSVTCSRK